jgi:drug/metabolite transporter (DMT)-like permease
MLPSQIIGSLFAIASALSWGGGDFTGGLAMRRGRQFHTLVVSMVAGLVVLIAVILIGREVFPPLDVIKWPILAGAVGCIGIGSLYIALSSNHSAIVAPASAVIGVAVPVLYNSLTAGLPPTTALIGFVLALAGIWLVSRTKADGAPLTTKGIILTIVSGLGFGGFYIFMAQVPRGYVFSPLVISRSTALLVALMLLLFSREPRSSFFTNPISFLAGVLDAGGNALYMLARQFTREDVAVVLSSIYPAINVLLAALLMKESVSRWQWLGVGLCVVAVALISV